MAFLGDGKQVRVALACLRKRQSGEWLRKKKGESEALKKMIKTVIKWAPVIYPIVRKIMKDRKASKQKNMSASRTAG